jgi:hypothetical protein
MGWSYWRGVFALKPNKILKIDAFSSALAGVVPAQFTCAAKLYLKTTLHNAPRMGARHLIGLCRCEFSDR